MAETSFSDEQIAEMREIEEERLALGESGLKEMFDVLIDRLKEDLRERRPSFKAGELPDGDLETLREMKTRDLWNIGVGRELGCVSFEEYLKDIPVIPNGLTKDPAFPLLVLEEPRISLRRLCELAGITMLVPNGNFVNMNDENMRVKTPRWIAIHDGRLYQGMTVEQINEFLEDNRIGLTALQGVCAYIQNPRIFSQDYCGMNLFGTCVMEGREEIPGLTSALLDIRNEPATVVRLGRSDNRFYTRAHGIPMRKVV